MIAKLTKAARLSVGLRDYFAAHAPPCPDGFVHDEDWSGVSSYSTWIVFKNKEIEAALIEHMRNLDYSELPLDSFSRWAYSGCTTAWLELVMKASPSVRKRADRVYAEINRYKRSYIAVRRRHLKERLTAWAYAYADSMLEARKVK